MDCKQGSGGDRLTMYKRLTRDYANKYICGQRVWERPTLREPVTDENAALGAAHPPSFFRRQ